MYLLCSGRGAAVPVLMVRAGGLYLRAPSTRGIGASLYLYLRCAPEYSFDRQSFDHIKHLTLWMSINELKTNGLTGKSHRQPILSSRNYGEAKKNTRAQSARPSDACTRGDSCLLADSPTQVVIIWDAPRVLVSFRSLRCVSCVLNGTPPLGSRELQLCGLSVLSGC